MTQCDHGKPCGHCVKHGYECVPDSARGKPGRRPAKSSGSNTSSDDDDDDSPTTRKSNSSNLPDSYGGITKRQRKSRGKPRRSSSPASAASSGTSSVASPTCGCHAREHACDDAHVFSPRSAMSLGSLGCSDDLNEHSPPMSLADLAMSMSPLSVSPFFTSSAPAASPASVLPYGSHQGHASSATAAINQALQLDSIQSILSNVNALSQLYLTSQPEHRPTVLQLIAVNLRVLGLPAATAAASAASTPSQYGTSNNNMFSYALPESLPTQSFQAASAGAAAAPSVLRASSSAPAPGGGDLFLSLLGLGKATAPPQHASQWQHVQHHQPPMQASSQPLLPFGLSAASAPPVHHQPHHHLNHQAFAADAASEHYALDLLLSQMP